MTYSPIKFEISLSYVLGGDTFARNVMAGRMAKRIDGRMMMDRFGTKYTLFFNNFKEKVGIAIVHVNL